MQCLHNDVANYSNHKYLFVQKWMKMLSTAPDISSKKCNHDFLVISIDNRVVSLCLKQFDKNAASSVKIFWSKFIDFDNTKNVFLNIFN